MTSSSSVHSGSPPDSVSSQFSAQCAQARGRSRHVTTEMVRPKSDEFPPVLPRTYTSKPTRDIPAHTARAGQVPGPCAFGAAALARPPESPPHPDAAASEPACDAESHGIAHNKRAACPPISATQRTASDTPYIDIAQSFCQRPPAYSLWPNSRRLDPDWITKWPRFAT